MEKQSERGGSSGRIQKLVRNHTMKTWIWTPTMDGYRAVMDSTLVPEETRRNGVLTCLEWYLLGRVNPQDHNIQDALAGGQLLVALISVAGWGLVHLVGLTMLTRNEVGIQCLDSLRGRTRSPCPSGYRTDQTQAGVEDCPLMLQRRQIFSLDGHWRQWPTGSH
jgi:hypothetical protein